MEINELKAGGEACADTLVGKVRETFPGAKIVESIEGIFDV